MKIKEILQKQGELYKNLTTNKTIKKYNKIIKESILAKYWKWTNLEYLTEGSSGYREFLSPEVYKRMKNKADDIFTNLEMEIQKGVSPIELKTKYEFLINWFWDDLHFLNDEDSKIPSWVLKNLTEEGKKEVKESLLHPIVYNGCRCRMLFYLSEILFKREMPKQEFIAAVIEGQLKYYWEWANLEEITEKPDEDGWYISPEIYKKMKAEASNIFNFIGKKIQEGANLTELEKVCDFLVEWFWDDFGFLINGYTIPKKILKGLTKKQEENAGKCSINMLTWGECRSEMNWHIKDVLFGKEHFRDF